MKKPGKRRLLSVVLMLLGGTGLLGVFWLLPYMSRSHDGEWKELHSERGQWEHTQDFIHRFFWRHDDTFPVGKYGGREWAEWIIARAQRTEDDHS